MAIRPASGHQLRHLARRGRTSFSDRSGAAETEIGLRPCADCHRRAACLASIATGLRSTMLAMVDARMPGSRSATRRAEACALISRAAPAVTVSAWRGCVRATVEAVEGPCAARCAGSSGVDQMKGAGLWRCRHRDRRQPLGAHRPRTLPMAFNERASAGARTQGTIVESVGDAADLRRARSRCRY